jgi:radical SAM protein with 4Fe4S-binding SPASM domain
VNEPFVSVRSIKDFSLWEEIKNRRFPVSFAIETTVRCNNSCRHCYINLPSDDQTARAGELGLEEISRIADEAVSMGTLACLITGGEPLLRQDFKDIYLELKKKGLLVSVFSNATIITSDHIKLFKDYPPQTFEVTVYGVTKETYEAVTQTPGSFSAFMKGLDALLNNGIRVRLKAVFMKSNVHEQRQISQFCRQNTTDFFRFDPMLHLRFDRNEKLNELIRAERLTPEEIAAIESSDAQRFDSLMKNCDNYIFSEVSAPDGNRIFGCGAGKWSFNVGHTGLLRVCSSLWHPDLMYDLRKGSLKEAWEVFIPKILEMKSGRREYHESCGRCPVINLCLWCPAHAYLETGELDLPVDSFCKIAHARAEMIQKAKSDEKSSS